MDYYKISADYGEPISMHNIGVFNKKGLGVQINYEKANYWFDKEKSKSKIKQKASYDIFI